MGPGTKFPTLGQIPYADLRDAYEEQAAGLLEGGVDLLIIETVFDLLSAKAAINGARRAMAAVGRQVPLQVQVTIELTGRMLPGTEIGAALAALDAMQVDVIGLNCATGPGRDGRAAAPSLRPRPVPVALPPQRRAAVGGRRQDALRPDPRPAGRVPPPLRHRARGVGHRRMLRHHAGPPGRRGRAVRRARPRPTRAPGHEPSAASIYTAVPFAQDTSFLVVGERTNANGSKRFREAMLEGDWDTCVAMARDQVKEGAHVIDVCVDYTGADGVADMTEVASRLATQSSVPLMVDSTEGPVVRAALEWLGGRPC